MISIIMPVYNSEKYLHRAIESILNQTYQTLEIILINDGSTDTSGQICDDYANKDNRIKVIHNKNAGVSAARNTGIDAATGDWIGFVDSDDWIEPDMYEKLLLAASKHHAMISVCGYEKRHLDNWIETQAHPDIPTALPGTEALEYVLRTHFFEGFMWNKLFDKKLFEPTDRRLDTNLHFCEDLAFVTELFIASPIVAYIPEALYHYCISPQSSMVTFDAKRETELVARHKVLDIVKLNLPQYPQYARHIKAGYADAAISMLYAAGKYGQHRPGLKRYLQKESLRYGASYFLSSETKIKMKLRALMIIAIPVASVAVWGWLKRRTNVTWYPDEIRKIQ